MYCCCVDVSEYAIENAMDSVKADLKIGSADQLDFLDNSFDLVISINSTYNLPPDRCSKALQEIEHVSRGTAILRWMRGGTMRNEKIFLSGLLPQKLICMWLTGKNSSRKSVLPGTIGGFSRIDERRK